MFWAHMPNGCCCTIKAEGTRRCAATGGRTHGGHGAQLPVLEGLLLHIVPFFQGAGLGVEVARQVPPLLLRHLLAER